MFGITVVKSKLISIGFSPVKPSSGLEWRVTLILWSSNLGFELINFWLISFNISLENTDLPSWSKASESSQTEYIVLFSSIKFSDISLAPTVILITSLSAPPGVLEFISQPSEDVIFK